MAMAIVITVVVFVAGFLIGYIAALDRNITLVDSYLKRLGK